MLTLAVRLGRATRRLEVLLARRLLLAGKLVNYY